MIVARVFAGLLLSASAVVGQACTPQDPINAALSANWASAEAYCRSLIGVPAAGTATTWTTLPRTTLTSTSTISRTEIDRTTVPSTSTRTATSRETTTTLTTLTRTSVERSTTTTTLTTDRTVTALATESSTTTTTSLFYITSTIYLDVTVPPTFVTSYITVTTYTATVTANLRKRQADPVPAYLSGYAPSDISSACSCSTYPSLVRATATAYSTTITRTARETSFTTSSTTRTTLTRTTSVTTSTRTATSISTSTTVTTSDRTITRTSVTSRTRVSGTTTDISTSTVLSTSQKYTAVASSSVRTNTLVATTTTSAIATVTNSNSNIVQNPGFESGATSPWVLTGVAVGAAASFSYNAISGSSQSGSYAGVISNPYMSSGVFTFAQTLPANGIEFSASVWVEISTSGPQTCAVALVIDNQRKAEQTLTTPADNLKWVQLTATHWPQLFNMDFRVTANCTGSGGLVAFLIDDAVVTKLQ